MQTIDLGTFSDAELKKAKTTDIVYLVLILVGIVVGLIIGIYIGNTSGDVPVFLKVILIIYLPCIVGSLITLICLIRDAHTAGGGCAMLIGEIIGAILIAPVFTIMRIVIISREIVEINKEQKYREQNPNNNQY